MNSFEMDVYLLVDWALQEHRRRVAELSTKGTLTTLGELNTIYAIGGEILDRAEEIRKRHSWQARLRRRLHL